MQISSCLYPNLVKNPYNDQVVAVPCGICEGCLNSRAQNWVQRLDVERQSWKYCVYCTLTYDELTCPRAVFNASRDQYRIVLPGRSVSFVSEWYTVDFTSWNDDDYRWFRNNKVIRVGFYKDVQNFIKLLKYKLFKRSKYEVLRYALCLEYGETTYRPHYHIVFFFSSERIREKILPLIRENWSFCDWSVQKPNSLRFVPSMDFRYIAAYINSHAHIPAFLSSREIRQRFISSKNPPIGSHFFNYSEISKILSSGLTKFEIPNKSSTQYVDVQLWSYLQNRLFPRIKGYGEFSHSERMLLYGLYKFTDYVRFKDLVSWFTSNEVKEKVRSKTFEYFKIYDLCSKISGAFVNIEALKRLYYISKRVCMNCMQFGYTLDQYVDLIEQYYYNRDQERLRNFYTLQSEFSERYDSRSLVIMYLSSRNCNWDNYKHTFGFYKYEKVDAQWLDLNKSPSYREYRDLMKRIYSRSVKSKKKNDYMRAHPELYNLFTY